MLSTHTANSRPDRTVYINALIRIRIIKTVTTLPAVSVKMAADMATPSVEPITSGTTNGSNFRLRGDKLPERDEILMKLSRIGRILIGQSLKSESFAIKKASFDDKKEEFWCFCSLKPLSYSWCRGCLIKDRVE